MIPWCNELKFEQLSVSAWFCGILQCRPMKLVEWIRTDLQWWIFSSKSGRKIDSFDTRSCCDYGHKKNSAICVERLGNRWGKEAISNLVEKKLDKNRVGCGILSSAFSGSYAMQQTRRSQPSTKYRFQKNCYAVFPVCGSLKCVRNQWVGKRFVAWTQISQWNRYPVQHPAKTLPHHVR